MATRGEGDGIEAATSPREYQIELFNCALERNSIICLKTGSGKTFISVLLIKELQDEVRRPYTQDGKRTFFLVPKVALVQQQADVISAHTILKVGTYWGSCGVDNWTKDDWEKQLIEKEVLVMTTQILLNMLDYGFIKMEKINLLVMDECHRAVKNDALCNLMKHYYKLDEMIKSSTGDLGLKLPRILGLTASVLHGRCNVYQIADNIKKLELTLCSRIVTADDLETVNRYSTKPVEVCLGFSTNNSSYAELTDVVSSVLVNCRDEIEKILKMLPLGEVTTTANISKREQDGRLVSEIEDKERLLNDLKVSDSDEITNIGINVKCSPGSLIKNVHSVYDTLGSWATREILKSFLEDLPKFKEDAGNLGMLFKRDIFDKLEKTFNCLVLIFDNYFAAYSKQQGILIGASQRLRRLLDLLKAFPNTDNTVFRGIVFVEQRAVAWMLNNYLLTLARYHTAEYGHFHPCYIVGHGFSLAYTHKTGMDVDDQCRSLINFKKGITNLLVGTSVVEEGVDIPECNVVVRFDLPKTFCSYVQSKGRARSQQAIYVLMHPESEKEEVAKDLTCYKGLEQELVKISKRNKAKQNEDISVDKLDDFDLMYRFVTKTGASLTINSAICILIRYCTSLPHDRFTTLQPTFIYVQNSSSLMHLCALVRLPSATPMEEKDIEGALCTDKKTAKKLAAFEACKRLFEIGELNEHLLPSQNYNERYQHELGIAQITQDTDAKAGTKKRRQTYEKAVAKDFQNCFPFLNGPVYLYGIKMTRLAGTNVNANLYCGPYFGILTSKPITKVIPFELYGKYNCTVFLNLIDKCYEEKIDLDSLKQFHHFVFDDVCRITNSLFTFSPECIGSFLIVPLTGNNIDWTLVNRCRQYKEGKINHSSFDISVGDVMIPTYGDLTSKSRRYYVTKVSDQLDDVASRSTVQDLVKRLESKYDVKLTQLKQPLLRVDFVPNTLNLLSSLIATKAKKSAIYLFPEICKVFPLNINQFREAFCLPSALFRLNGLLLANELKCTLMNEANVLSPNLESEYMLVGNTLEKLSEECVVKDDVIFLPNLNGQHRLSSDRLLAALFQALTTNSSNNWDCLERLEVIGDSFLKIAVSVFLFCNYSQLHEGGLTTLRTGLVRNFNLVSHAKLIPNILNGHEFQPRFSWLPPGFVVPKDLLNNLIEHQIPTHLWVHADCNDLTNSITQDGNAFKFLLDIRRGAVDKSRQIKPKKLPATEKLNNDESGSDSNEEFFDRYNKHLIGDKTIADSVEAIIGAVLVTCGRTAALRVINWFGLKILSPNTSQLGSSEEDDMEVDEEPPFPWKVQEFVLKRFNSRMCDKYNDLLVLEENLGYHFNNKGLLIQAVIHPTFDVDVVDNYQKLEFLGDAVLDYLVTMHLYKNMPNLNPGDMTDLRSALVDNGTFAYLAVKNNFHKALRHRSSLLFGAIDTYLEYHKHMKHPKESIYMTKESDANSLEETEVPKVLSDIFESIAGAVFVDSGLSLIAVWKVFGPLLEDVMKQYSEALPINPIRCLLEKFPRVVFGVPKKVESGYSIAVSFNGHTYFGSSSKKKVAKVAAAKNALRSLNISSVRNLQ
ncbi:Endoribonuclease Dicer [Chamberlinius hualienensis]